MIKNLIFFCLVALTCVPGQAQAATTATTAVSTANDAFNTAKAGVDPSLRDRIVSLYGVGTPAGIQTWWVIFYDPSVPSHGRVVKVENGQITRTYEAKGGMVYIDSLTFAGSRLTGEGPALAAAQNYAARHALAYDNVRALLRVTTTNQAFRWRVQLLDGSASKGFVFVNASDGTFATYAPPGSVPTKGGTGTGGIAGDAHRAANDVKNTFLGIGGDPITDPARLHDCQKVFTALALPAVSPTDEAIRTEMENAFAGLAGKALPTVNSIDRVGVIIIGTPQNSPLIAGLPWVKDLDALGTEGYAIRSTTMNGHAVTMIASIGEIGTLYGAFDLLRRIRTGSPVTNLAVEEQPRLKLRLLDHWDNLDGSIERGYGGKSLWNGTKWLAASDYVFVSNILAQRREKVPS